MKRIICSLLVFCLLLPALAFAAPSQKLQAIYDSVDTLNAVSYTHLFLQRFKEREPKRKRMNPDDKEETKMKTKRKVAVCTLLCMTRCV